LSAVRSPCAHARVRRRGRLRLLWIDSCGERGDSEPTGRRRSLRLRRSGPAAAAPQEEVLHSVQCSQCAGPLSVREGRRILVCSHCGVRVAVKEHGGFSRWYFPRALDRLRAAASRKPPGCMTTPVSLNVLATPRFVDARLTYVPIWEHKALLAGWGVRPQGCRQRLKWSARSPRWGSTRYSTKKTAAAGTQAGREGGQGAASPGATLLSGRRRRWRLWGRFGLVSPAESPCFPAGGRTGPFGDGPGGRRDQRRSGATGRAVALVPLSGRGLPTPICSLFGSRSRFSTIPCGWLAYQAESQLSHTGERPRRRREFGVAPADNTRRTRLSGAAGVRHGRRGRVSGVPRCDSRCGPRFNGDRSRDSVCASHTVDLAIPPRWGRWNTTNLSPADLVPLLCDNCGLALEGGDDAALFICPNCGSVHEPSEDGFASFSPLTASVTTELAVAGGVRYLAVWRLTVSISAASDSAWSASERPPLRNPPISMSPASRSCVRWYSGWE